MNNRVPHYDLDRGPRLAVRTLVGALGVFLLLALVWMSFAKLDISVQAGGQVIPSARVQQVQSLEGGILRQLAVREGQQVRRGELLAYVENLQYDAELGKDQREILTLQAAGGRLAAELADQPPVFAPELQAQAADQVARQRQLWAERRRQRDDALETTQRLIVQRTAERGEVEVRIASVERLLVTARETLAMEEALHKAGAGAYADMLRARQEVERLTGELESQRAALVRLQAAIEEARARNAQIRSTYRAEASREYSEVEAKLASLRALMMASADRVQRRALHAPVDGVVNRLLIHTLGGVVRPGETLMELVPQEDTLLIAVKVKPADIAFVRVGQEAHVRITAYDASVFGKIKAKVVRVGADALIDERTDQSYFEVVLQTERNYVGRPEERLTINPGMAADVSIQTGQRTVLEYLLKPVVKTFDKALRER